MKIQSYYNRERAYGMISFKNDPSRTKQSFAEEADINNIMHQYVKTGILPSGTHQLNFGDFSSGEEYADLLGKILDARADFDLLDSSIRERFANSPEQLIRFMSNPDNKEEAIRLGLLPDPKAKVVEPTTPKVEPEPTEPNGE